MVGVAALTDIWGFDLDENVWTKLASYLPAVIRAYHEPAAVLGWSRQVRFLASCVVLLHQHLLHLLLLVEVAVVMVMLMVMLTPPVCVVALKVLFTSVGQQQQWLWNFDDRTWEPTFFGQLPPRQSAAFVSTGGAVYAIGGENYSGMDALDSADTMLWETSNRTIRHGLSGSDAMRWEMRVAAAAGVSPPGFAARSNVAAAHIAGTAASVENGGRILVAGGTLSGAHVDEDSDGLIDVALLRSDSTDNSAPCTFAPPAVGHERNSSVSELVVPGYDGSVVLADESVSDSRCCCSWLCHPALYTRPRCELSVQSTPCLPWLTRVCLCFAFCSVTGLLQSWSVVDCERGCNRGQVRTAC